MTDCLQLHFMRLGHFSCAWGMHGVASYAPCACKKSGRNCLFLLSKWVKPALLAQTQVKSHYKYQPSTFRIYRSELEQFKRKATLELRKCFYLLLF